MNSGVHMPAHENTKVHFFMAYDMAFKLASSTEPAGLNDKCGGFLGVQCVEPLQCIIDVLPGNASRDDEEGICLPKEAELGESCGGFSSRKCAAGLYCFYQNPGVDGGVCKRQTLVGLEEMCDGTEAIKCVDPYICVHEAYQPNSTGKCYPPTTSRPENPENTTATLTPLPTNISGSYGYSTLLAAIFTGIAFSML